jgi:hypothetical protein
MGDYDIWRIGGKRSLAKKNRAENIFTASHRRSLDSALRGARIPF